MISWTKSTFVNLTGSKYKPADYRFLCILQLNLLSAIQHENLVPLLGYCCEYDQQILVYPFMSNGSLQDRLYGTSHPKFFSSIIFSFLYIYIFIYVINLKQGKQPKEKLWTGQPGFLLLLVLLEASNMECPNLLIFYFFWICKRWIYINST